MLWKRMQREFIRHSSGVLGFLAAAILVLSPSFTDAAGGPYIVPYWQVSFGNWGLGSNWAGGYPPIATHDAYITNGGIATISVLLASCDSLYLGGSSTGTIQMTDSSLSTNYSYIGNVGPAGTGTFNQSGGTNTVANDLDLGYDAGASGVYNLSGTSQLATYNNEYVGYSGTGTFSHIAGTNSTSVGFLYLGYNSNSAGMYDLSGTGQLSSISERIGYNGEGTFTQSGGTNNIHPSQRYYGFILGYNTGSNGTYNLSGSGILSVGWGGFYGCYGTEFIGYSGSATFNQTGGTNTVLPDDYVTGELDVGCNSGGVGTYNLSGNGQLILEGGNECIGASGTGTFMQSGGADSTCNNLLLASCPGSSGSYDLSGTGRLTAGGECIGNSGTGVFTQSGGTNTMSGMLSLGCSYDGHGSYSLSGTGQVSAAEEHVGEEGTGAFTQSGGTNAVSNVLYVGWCGAFANGSYNLNGTGQLTAGEEMIGAYSGASGTFTQSGGTNTVSNILSLGYDTGTNGSYNLSGTGQLSAHTEYVACYGSAVFTQSGGTNTVYGDLNLGCNGGSNGTYSISGGTLDVQNGDVIVGGGGTGQFNLNGGLVIADRFQLGSSGAFSGSGQQCILRVNRLVGFGDNVSLNCSLQIGHSGGAGSGSYTLGSGQTFSVSSVGIGYDAPATFTQSGGTNSVSNLYLGYNAGASGTFTQSGGTNSAYTLYLGYNAGASGTYNLDSTGGVSASNEYVGYSGTGTFTQSSGTNTLTMGRLGSAGQMLLGRNANSSGTYNLSGTGLLNGASGGEMVGYSGMGTFLQSGGTNTMGYELCLGYNRNSSGTYNLSGTGFLTGAGEYIGESGTGNFIQSAGVNTVSNNVLYLGYDTGSNGSYNLSGTGQLSAMEEHVGESGSGTFTHSAGTNTVSSNFYLGFNSGSNGTYNLSGTGQLSAPTEYVGYSGTGTFNHSAGTNSVSSNLYAGTQGYGTYNLSGTGQLSAPTEYIGGQSGMNQSGGTNTASNVYVEGYPGISRQTGGTNIISSKLYLGYLSGGEGYYSLSGSGSLSVGQEIRVGADVGDGRFEWLTNSLYTPTLTLGGGGQLMMGFDFNMEDLITGTLFHGSKLGGLSSATLAICNGATATQTGSTQVTVGDMYIGRIASGGTSNGTYNLSGSGQLTINAGMTVGFTGVGILNQSGGTIITPEEDLGWSSYPGSINQTGGTNTVSTLVLGTWRPGSSGTYNLNGGTLILSSLQTGGGTATFNFGGGTLQASGDFSSSLPMTLTGTGGNAKVNTNGHAVTLSGVLSGIGGLSKSGAGTLTLSAANYYNGTTTVAGGTLELQTVAARHPVFDLGGADIQAGRIVFDYASGADPVATIQGLLRASCDGSRWDVGQFKDSIAATTGLTLGCFDDTSLHQVKVMATYPGDFNLDGVVDNLDRNIWFAGAFFGTTWQQGDANYDGVVDGLDRDLMLAHTGMPPIAGMSAAAGVTPVPEPGSLTLLAAGLAGLLAYARRSKRRSLGTLIVTN